MNLRETLHIALLTAISLVLFLVEGLIPLPFIAPGAKLGLANIVTVYALYTLPQTRDAIQLILLRTLLAAFFGGGPTIFLFSISGGMLSLFSMWLLKKSRYFSLPAVSAAGGFSHHLGQLIFAAWTADTLHIFRYFPILGICGIVTGFIIGVLAAKICHLAPYKHS
ncbi:heptaprenyl diphosphate synthase [Selenomonas ruminantium]|uniref:Heptaprenyl diphosphate synthase n=1 Tax=Selenomonas ruminantium TaxID=971 RepID=A0A1M6VTM1_SELRU|nr:Gx transporter family protein [Selenomonas ruminantium]SHK84685.1 heptaprenyl diphosphate synthase [Selenomonas ruminantium]